MGLSWDGRSGEQGSSREQGAWSWERGGGRPGHPTGCFAKSGIRGQGSRCSRSSRSLRRPEACLFLRRSFLEIRWTSCPSISAVTRPAWHSAKETPSITVPDGETANEQVAHVSVVQQFQEFFEVVGKRLLVHRPPPGESARREAAPAACDHANRHDQTHRRRRAGPRSPELFGQHSSISKPTRTPSLWQCLEFAAEIRRGAGRKREAESGGVAGSRERGGRKDEG